MGLSCPKHGVLKEATNINSQEYSREDHLVVLHVAGAAPPRCRERLPDPGCLRRRMSAFLEIMVNVNGMFKRRNWNECHLGDSQKRTGGENMTQLFKLKSLFCSSTLIKDSELSRAPQFTTLPEHVIQLII